ncbi:MAG: restriction endonuclease subunit S [Bacteroidota bacterium]
MKKGWDPIPLQDICTFGNGLWTGKKPPYLEVGVIRNTNFTKDGELDDSDIVYLKVEQGQFVKRRLHFGDIILEKSGGGPKQPVGRVIIFDKEDGDFSFSNFTSVLRIINKKQVNFRFLHRYLYHLYISGVTEKMQSHSTGIRNLKFDDYKQIRVPLPPLSEQQHIVTILDEAFGAIAKAKENAEKNIKNTKEIFNSVVENVFTNGNGEWNYNEFSNVIVALTDYHANGSYEILKENVELKENEDYAWMVRSTDFEQNFQNGFRYIDKNSYEFLKKSKIFGGEIIMSKIGNAGKVYLMPNINRPCSLAMNLFLIRVDERKAIPEFIYRFLNSINGETQILSRLNGMATKTITKDNVKSILIPIPQLKEQHHIVSIINTLASETKNLESIYHQKLADLDELKKSILEKAFAGELTIN